MVMHAEWSTVEDAEIQYSDVPGFFEDGGGGVNSGPALAIFTGTNGAIIEAETSGAMIEMLERVAASIRRRRTPEQVAALYGERAAELATLTITTKLPAKWMMVDRETGDRWEWRDGTWKRAVEAQ